MRYQAPKGTQDILPEDQPYWRHIEERIHALCGAYGYRPIGIPMFEETELFVRGVGDTTDIVEKEMYTFEDLGGRSLTLRPEFTAGVMRAYIEHGMHVQPQPVKLYSIGPVFRYEAPQAGRFRQHHQWNVEAVGEADPAVDWEVMSLAWHLYEDLGFRSLSFELNSTGCPVCRPGYSRELVAYYQHHLDEVCEDCRRRLDRNPLRVLDCKQDQCQPVIAGAPHMLDHLCSECAAHFATLRHMLDVQGQSYRINHRLVRGLDYYTKTVFEVWAEGIGAQNAVCGGGRYDGLVELLGGNPTPGIGFASGIERLVMTMKHQGLPVPPLPDPAVALLYLGEAAKERCLELADGLRRAEVATTLVFGDRGLRAQMRRADRENAAWAVILGDNELEAGQATVRNMVSGGQTPVPLGTLIEWLVRHVRGAQGKA
jgi:histidyl-tRNA synthetase